MINPSIGIFNSPSSSLHLRSPFLQNRCGKIHHHFISFLKQLVSDLPPRRINKLIFVFVVLHQDSLTFHNIAKQ